MDVLVAISVCEFDRLVEVFAFFYELESEKGS